MNEKPIIFSAAMVRAILENRKTQTRRIVKFPKWANAEKDAEKLVLHNGLCYINDCGTIEKTFSCPYGIIGDRLWVRETFNSGWCDHVIYRADGGSAMAAGYTNEPKWKPSIFMPRWASRITLEITNVRVEKLQKISAADAFAEGVSSREWVDQYNFEHVGYSADWSRLGELSRYAGGLHPRNQKQPLTVSDICLGSPQMAYANLWIKINGRDSWDANPWVFVIEFERKN